MDITHDNVCSSMLSCFYSHLLSTGRPISSFIYFSASIFDYHLKPETFVMTFVMKHNLFEIMILYSSKLIISHWCIKSSKVQEKK